MERASICRNNSIHALHEEEKEELYLADNMVIKLME